VEAGVWKVPSSSTTGSTSVPCIRRIKALLSLMNDTINCLKNLTKKTEPYETNYFNDKKLIFCFHDICKGNLGKNKKEKKIM
jgi:hypothetical protein